MKTLTGHGTNEFTIENGKCNLYTKKELRLMPYFSQSLFSFYSGDDECTAGAEKATKISGTKFLFLGETGRAWLV